MTALYLPGMESEQRDPELSQWFTEPELAAKVWHWANQRKQPRWVLEPAAGQGALIRPIHDKPYKCERVAAVELDTRHAFVLAEWMRRARTSIKWQTIRADFLEVESPLLIQPFDVALMNPPYEDEQAERFVLKALAFAPRVVGIFKSSLLHGVRRYQTLWARVRVQRMVYLASRPSFGRGVSGGKQAESDFVVLDLELSDTEREAHWVRQEHWP